MYPTWSCQNDTTDFKSPQERRESTQIQKTTRRLHCLMLQQVFNLLNTEDSPVPLGTTSCSRNYTLRCIPVWNSWSGQKKKIWFAPLWTFLSGITSKEAITIWSRRNTTPVFGWLSESWLQRTFLSCNTPHRKVNKCRSYAGDSIQLHSLLSPKVILTQIYCSCEILETNIRVLIKKYVVYHEPTRLCFERRTSSIFLNEQFYDIVFPYRFKVFFVCLFWFTFFFFFFFGRLSGG